MGYLNCNVLTEEKTAILDGQLRGIDILGLGETGEGAPVLPGFVRYGSDTAIPPSAGRGGGRGQGLYWFVRSSLSTYVKKVWENQHIIWLKLETPCGDPWYLAAVYLPPQGSVQWLTPQHREDAFETLKEQVLQYQYKGHVYVVGDFNAHVGVDNAVADAAAEILEAVNEVANAGSTRVTQVAGREVPSRTSMDQKQVDAGGRFLLKLCQEADCVVLNGRATGDETGAFTYHKVGKAGRILSQSVLDYGLCNRDAFGHVSSFKVLGFDPTLSDHCMVRCELVVPAQENTGSSGSPTLCFPRYVAAKRLDYVKALLNADVQRELQDIAEMSENNQQDLEACKRLEAVIHQVACRVFGVAGSQQRTACGHLPKRWFKHVRHEHAALKSAIRRGDTHAAAALRKVFNKAKRKWQAFYTKQYHSKLIDDLRHNPRKFWNLYKGPGMQSRLHTMEQLDRHWKQLYGQQGQGLPDLFGDTRAMLAHLAQVAQEKASEQRIEAARELNKPLEDWEVELALHKSHLGRAPGPDGLRIEFFKEAYVLVPTGRGRDRRVYILLPVLHNLLKNLFCSGHYPENWSAAALTAVYKKGDAGDLNNYRGIAVGNVLGKLFGSVLNTRLDTYAERIGARAEGQAGFRRGRSTIDHVFVLRHLIDRTRFSSVAAKLYLCFVDFQKAFDRVLRGLLMERLAALGLHGEMIQALGNIYWHVSLQTKVQHELGRPFLSTTGVKQGDPLSPLLFGLFIDEFEEWLETRLPDVGVECGGKLIRMLLYADDMVLIATSPCGLQQQLDLLSEFCTSKGLQVNLAKTEIVVYRKAGSKLPQGLQWLYEGQQVQVSDSFRYLGVWLHSTKGLSVARDALKAAGQRAMWAMLGKFKNMQLRDLYLKTHMFDTLVKPVLSYGCEVWGPDALQHIRSAAGMLDNSLQEVQTLFMRQLGKFRKSTCRQVMLKELCWVPLSAHWCKMIVCYWNQLAKFPSTMMEGIFHDCVRMGCVNNVGWAAMVLQMLRQLGLGTIADQIVREVKTAVDNGDTDLRLPSIDWGTVEAAWGTTWDKDWEAVAGTPPRQCADGITLATYKHWMAASPVADEITGIAKNDPTWYRPGMPEYVAYTHLVSPSHLIDFMRFRCGSHNLAVATGRWNGCPRGQRICQKCTADEVEDEYHVMLRCSAYESLRVSMHARYNLFACVGGIYRARRAGDEGMLKFMNQTPRHVARFVSECLQLRDTKPDLTRHFEDYHVDLFSSDGDG